MKRLRRLSSAAVTAVAALLSGCFGSPAEPIFPEVVDVVSPESDGVWLKADFHTHSKFSDGGLDIEAVCVEAIDHGVQVLAVTDHLDRLDVEELPDYFERLDVLRRQFPQLCIIDGVEWNVPGYHSESHSNILLPPTHDIADMADFKGRHDDSSRYAVDVEDQVAAAFETLKRSTPGAVVLLNHPCRDFHRPSEAEALVRRMAAASDQFAGFAGAPGHQAGIRVGDYGKKMPVEGRLDPLTTPDGLWDEMRGEGVAVHAAFASSDFHTRHIEGKSVGDFWPGEFSATWVRAEEPSCEAVLKALKTGQTSASVGGMFGPAELSAEPSAPGLLRRGARTGETLRLPRSMPARMTVRCETEFTGGEAEIEWVVVGGPEVAVERQTTDAAMFLHDTFLLDDPGEAGDESAERFVRVVGRHDDSVFWTNFVRIEWVGP